MIESTRSFPLFRVLTFGILRVERLIDARQGTYATVPTSAFRGTYPRIVLRSLLCSPTRSLRRNVLLDRMITEGEESAEGEMETDPEKLAAQRLKNAVIALRNIFTVPQGVPSLLVLDETQTYQLAGQAQIWVDADACQGLLDEAQQQMHHGGNPLELVKEAAGYFAGGRFLEDEDGWWVLGRRGSLDALHQTCMRLLVDIYEQNNLLLEAEAYLRGVLEAYYGNQEAYYRLMMVLTKQGKYPEALILADSIQERFAVEEGDEEERKLIEATKALILQVKKLWRQQKQHMLTTMTSPLQMGNNLLDTEKESSVLLEGDIRRQHDHHSEWTRQNTSGLPSSHTLPSEQGMLFTSLRELEDTMTHDPFKRETLQKLTTALGIGVVGKYRNAGSLEWWERLTYAKPSTMNRQTFHYFEHLLECGWGLSNTGELEAAEQLLTGFLPRMAQLASHQRRAAFLTAEGMRLQGVLAAHQQRLLEKLTICLQAVEYARQAQDPDILVAQLTELAVAFKYARQPANSFKTYQEALSYCQHEQVSPLVRSRLYAACAATFAINGHKQEAQAYLEQAYTDYPTQVNGETTLLMADNGLFMISYYEGLLQLALHQPIEADKAFEQGLARFSQGSIPERWRLIILNYQGLAAILSNQQEKYVACLADALSSAPTLRSKKRFDEALTIFQHYVPPTWLSAPRIKQVIEQFQLEQEYERVEELEV